MGFFKQWYIHMALNNGCCIMITLEGSDMQIIQITSSFVPSRSLHKKLGRRKRLINIIMLIICILYSFKRYINEYRYIFSFTFPNLKNVIIELFYQLVTVNSIGSTQYTQRRIMFSFLMALWNNLFEQVTCIS